jgi:arylsulfatase A-like enzyme
MRLHSWIRQLLLAVAATFCAATYASAATTPAAANRPNILLILADDMGYGELSCQGNPEIPTPNIDSIAKHGIRFTSGYVSGPCCGPSRAGLMTGRYQQRFGFEFNLGAGGGGLPIKEKTIADRLKAAGYATGMFGKWHLGYAPKFEPTRRGFDWYFGFAAACRPYHIHPGELGKSLLDEARQMELTYTTDAFAAEASAFIEKHRAEPWFVYLPFNAVHASPASNRGLVPQDAGKYRARFPQIADGKRRTYAGMESAMDDAVGVVLAKLRALKLEENTLIFFLSDNGGPTWQTTSRNDPLRGCKGDVLEGGVREPFLIQWKGHLPAGKTDGRPIIQLDILPTALAAAGAPVSGEAQLDGLNLMPYLTGEKPAPPHKSLCWRYGKKHAIRMGDWKLTDEGDGAKLYDLAHDIGEKTDLAAKEPAKLKELEAAYDRWNAGNVSPRWGSNKAGKKHKASAAENVAFLLEDDP